MKSDMYKFLLFSAITTLPFLLGQKKKKCVTVPQSPPIPPDELDTMPPPSEPPTIPPEPLEPAPKPGIVPAGYRRATYAELPQWVRDAAVSVLHSDEPLGEVVYLDDPYAALIESHSNAARGVSILIKQGS